MSARTLGAMRIVFVLSLALAAVGCAALRDDLQRAEDRFEQARYDDADTWLESLEDSAPDMDPEMRARFYYLRGMTAYRLNRRGDALHYLALTREVAGEQHAGLRQEWTEVLDRTLAELDPNDTPAEGSAGGEVEAGVAN